MKCKNCGNDLDNELNGELCEKCKTTPEIEGETEGINEIEGFTNEEGTEANADVKNKPRPFKDVLNIIFTFITVLLIGLIAFSIHLYSVNKELCDNLNTFSKEVQILEEKVHSLEQKSAVNQATLNYLAEAEFFNELEHFANQGIVTDTYKVSKMTLFINQDGYLSGNVNLEFIQTPERNYSNQESFSYSERQLKNDIHEVADLVGYSYLANKEFYLNGDKLPNWNESVLSFSVNNQNVAVYADNTVHLLSK